VICEARANCIEKHKKSLQKLLKAFVVFFSDVMSNSRETSHALCNNYVISPSVEMTQRFIIYPTIFTILPGTIITFLGVRPCNCSCVFS